MSVPTKAVFLSYASQDADPARRIADALRAAGVEVWFDQNDLRGGDAWDAKIRRQIKDCALFVPVISENTQARLEGYFRLEWHLAERRMQHMHEGAPFLLPVVIDHIQDDDARVPAKFLEVQWTRLPNGETMSTFSERVKTLLRETGSFHAAHASGGSSAPMAADNGPPSRGSRPATSPIRQKRRTARVTGTVVGVFILVAVGGFFWTQRNSAPKAVAEPAKTATPAPSEARALLARALVYLEKPTYARVDLDAAAQLLEKASALDSNDPEIVAASANVDVWFIYNWFDRSPARRSSAGAKAARAMTLAPTGFEPRFAQANYFVRAAAQATFLPEAERILKALHTERPQDLRVLHALAVLYRAQLRDEEALATFAKLESLPGGPNLALTTKAWLFSFRGQHARAEETIDRALAVEPTVLTNLTLKLFLLQQWHGDLDRARDFVLALPAAARLEDLVAFQSYDVYLWRREPEQALQAIELVPREWLDCINYSGPKALLTGRARRLLNRPAAAQADFQRALALIEQRLSTMANDPLLLQMKAVALDGAGDRAGAMAIQKLATEAGGTEGLRGWSSSMGGGLIMVGLTLTDEDISQQMNRIEERVARPNSRTTAAILRLDPRLDHLRAEPRFQALLARMEKDPRLSPHAK